MDRIVVRDALTLDGIVYGPGQEIPPAVWLRLPKRERNRLLNLGNVERRWDIGVAIEPTTPMGSWPFGELDVQRQAIAQAAFLHATLIQTPEQLDIDRPFAT
jgi:hypothetical protein